MERKHGNHVGARRRGGRLRQFSIKDDKLDAIAKDAEAKNAARWRARNETREVHYKELERQQQQLEQENNDGDDSSEICNRAKILSNKQQHGSSHTAMATVSSYNSSRRSSEDSNESTDIRFSGYDIKQEIKILEEKYKNTVLNNARLDNEKSALMYQINMFKDQMMDMEEVVHLSKREEVNKKHDLEMEKHRNRELENENRRLILQLTELTELIKQNGLVIMGVEEEGKDGVNLWRTILVTEETSQLLKQVPEETIDKKLKKLMEEKNELNDQIYRLSIELEEERNKNTKIVKNSLGLIPNGPNDDRLEIQKELNRVVAEYKFKVQKAEQEIATLQANVTRLEGQVLRYKSVSDAAEKSENGLKIERRKLQRELREALSKIEELETCKSHLEKRLEKVKNSRSALLKEL